MMALCSLRYAERQPAEDAPEETTVRMIVSIALAFFIQLGPNRLSRFLDAIAETEFFHELTMID